MNAFFEQLSRLGATRLVVMFAVAFGVAAALTALAMQAGSPKKSLLYAGLELADVAAVTAQLERANIEYDVAAGGSAVYVPGDQVDNARLLLSAEGLPSSGSVGYEIFDRQDTLGATQFQQNLNRVRALEGELSRTIRAIDGVASARVHLALPERRLFDRNAEDPKASVWIELRHGDLGARHARTIRNLVAGAVPGLNPMRVTILDAEGRLLAGGAGDDPTAAGALAMEDRRTGLEEQVRKRVIDILESVVGPGKVRAQVSVQANFNRVTESAEIFDPDGQVVRSTQTIEETANDQDRENNGAVSVAENVPAGADDTADPLRTSQSNTNRTSESVNFEISKTTRTEIREGGDIQRLSVAVAVDGETSLSEDGEPIYTPRTDEEMQRLTTLVRSAIGFDPTRGDTVEVLNVRFATTLPLAAGTTAASGMAFGSNEIMRVAELGVMLVVAAMIIFLVMRPLLKGVVPPPVTALATVGAGAGSAAAGSAGGVATLTGVEGSSEGAPGLPSPDADASGVDISKIEGQVKASSVRKVSEFVEQHPDESVAIIRNWLHGADAS